MDRDEPAAAAPDDQFNPSFYDDIPYYSDRELLEGSIEDHKSTDRETVNHLIRQLSVGFNTFAITETTEITATITSYPACSS